MDKNQGSPVLVTGATGYIGGRLVPRLLSAGFQVRCLVRDTNRLQGRQWLKQVQIVQGDLLKADSVKEALRGVKIAYYFVHSLGSGSDFSQRDLEAARNFAAAAKEAGLERIIYLGGLGDSASDLSEHLRSRHNTGDALREKDVPVTEFRAGVIVGSGSISFEMIRYLTERLPVMICPRWVYTKIQPIAIRNVLDYLVEALRVPETAGKIIEIGGSNVITYGEMMMGYAEARGLKRRLVPVPVLTPKLSSYWVDFVTPIPASIARPLIAGLRNEIIVRDDNAKRFFPAIHPLDYSTAVKLALEKLAAREVETSWTDALSTSDRGTPPVTLTTREGMIIEQREMEVDATPEAIFKAFTGLGGDQGWLYMNWTWRVRGAIDRLYGGVGLRRGRRAADNIRVGEALDFWRVEAIEANHLILLRAEMKVPGRAWLQFDVKKQEKGIRPLLTQTAFFAPKGLSGFVYWYLLYPVHALIFRGMVKRVAALAEQVEKAQKLKVGSGGSRGGN